MQNYRKINIEKWNIWVYGYRLMDQSMVVVTMIIVRTVIAIISVHWALIDHLSWNVAHTLLILEGWTVEVDVGLEIVHIVDVSDLIASLIHLVASKNSIFKEILVLLPPFLLSVLDRVVLLLRVKASQPSSQEHIDVIDHIPAFHLSDLLEEGVSISQELPAVLFVEISRKSPLDARILLSKNLSRGL